MLRFGVEILGVARSWAMLSWRKLQRSSKDRECASHEATYSHRPRKSYHCPRPCASTQDPEKRAYELAIKKGESFATGK